MITTQLTRLYPRIRTTRGDRTSEDVAVLDHGLVLPAGLTRTGPDCVSLPGFVGLSGKPRGARDRTGWCDLIRACALKPRHWCVRPPGRCVPVLPDPRAERPPQDAQANQDCHRR